MDQQNYVQNTGGIPDTHYFVYHNKCYSIKFDFFKYYSDYFSENQITIQSSKNIQIIDESEDKYIELNDEIIQSFINYVQCQKILIDNTNVISLNYLSKKYKVLSLTKFTEEYISSHHKELILPILAIHQNDSAFDISSYEDIISDNFMQYVEDDRLLKFDVSTIHRILTKYLLKNTSKDLDVKIIDFLFKYLDRYGRKASVLFSDIDFCSSRMKYINQLLNKYSKSFDFHFINSSLLRTIYDTHEELLRNEEKLKLEQEQTNELINVQKTTYMKKFKDQKDEFDRQIRNLNNEIAELLNENIVLTEKEKKFFDQIEEMKNLIKQLMDKTDRQEKEIAQLNEKLNQKEIIIEKLTEKSNEQTNLIEKISKKSNEQNKQKSFHFVSDSKLDGIVSFLRNSITLSAGGLSGALFPLKKHLYQ